MAGRGAVRPPCHSRPMARFSDVRSSLGPNAIVFTRRQAHAQGLSDYQLRKRVADGTIVQVGPHAFRGALVDLTPLARLTCLIADIGEPVWVCRQTAAWLHGFDGYPPGRPFHLVTTRDRHMKRPGAVIHQMRRPLDPIDRTEVFGLPVTAAPRTVIDLARSESVARLTLAIDSGIRDGRFTEESLLRRVHAMRGRGRYGVPTLLEAIDGASPTRGGHSFLERAFLDVIHASGLPRPHTQVVTSRSRGRVIRVDFVFPDTDVVVEVLGIRYHRTPDQIRRDTERLNQLMIDGWRPFQYTSHHVFSEPEAVIAELTAALGSPTTKSRRRRRSTPGRNRRTVSRSDDAA